MNLLASLGSKPPRGGLQSAFLAACRNFKRLPFRANKKRHRRAVSFLLAEMGECHSCTQHPVLLKMAILYHRNPSLSTDSSHRRPAGNHSSACLFFRIAAAITSFTLSCLMAAGYFLTISASAALAARSSSLSSTNRAERSSQARILSKSPRA